MLNVPLYVNESRIGTAQIRRMEPLEDDRAIYIYRYNAHMTLQDGVTVTCTGMLRHNYDDGAVTLVRKVFQRIEAALAEKERETA